MKHLIIWRHGQTIWNASGRVQGHADVELADTGRAQAIAAAQRLAALNPTSIVSSDLLRAAQTAQALAGATGLPVRFDPRLRERYYGPWQGLTGSEISERWPEEYARWRAGAPTIGLGIESLDDLARRSSLALEEAAAEDQVIVAVTHGGTARQACGAMLGWPDQVVRTLSILKNCRWMELRFDQVRQWQLCSHNAV